jgi:hypothetical protein
MLLRARIDPNMSTTSSSLESQLATAVGEGKVPHAVVFAADRDGELLLLDLCPCSLIKRAAT